jgi:hypothetical protein
VIGVVQALCCCEGEVVITVVLCCVLCHDESRVIPVAAGAAVRLVNEAEFLAISMDKHGKLYDKCAPASLPALRERFHATITQYITKVHGGARMHGIIKFGCHYQCSVVLCCAHDGLRLNAVLC